MRAAERLALREPSWRELEGLLHRLELRGIRRRPPTDREEEIDGEAGRFEVDRGGVAAVEGISARRSKPLSALEVIRLGELHRSACADLMLAEAYDLPGDTVGYLHALVARGHNALYRAKGLSFSKWAAELFAAVPRQLRRDVTLPIAAAIFYGTFLAFGFLGATEPGFAERVLGEAHVATMEEMYAEPLSSRDREDAAMAGFYIFNNAGIGLMCYAAGMSFGIGTIGVLFSNAMSIGTVFGHMVYAPQAPQFFTFVTAHAPFELTAIVFAGAAGLRLGWGVVLAVAQRVAGLSWRDAVPLLQREARRSLPIAGSAVFLFILAAFLEGFVSASSLPYGFKVALALASAAALVVYVTLGGRTAPATARV